MRRATAFCCTLLLAAACAPSEEQPGTETATEGAAVATISLADIAGRWTIRAIPETGDTTVTYELIATANTEGWTVNFPGRDPLPARVWTSGDSITLDVGPYESVLRPGIMVTTHSIGRLQAGMLAGTFVAQYSTGPDSILHGKFEGTRAP